MAECMQEYDLMVVVSLVPRLEPEKAEAVE